MVVPRTVGFAESKDVCVQGVNGALNVVIVLAGGSVGKAMDLMIEASEDCGRFVVRIAAKRVVVMALVERITFVDGWCVEGGVSWWKRFGG